MCASPVIKRIDDDAPMTEAEWNIRVDLAACYRLVAHFDMDDLFATHISARVPGREEHFLINPYSVHFSEVTASNLVKVDLEGNIVQDTDHVINPAGFVIHSAIHGARPDAKCVLHTHTVAGMAIATMATGLQPWSQKATRYHKRLAYHDFEGKAQDLDDGRGWCATSATRITWCCATTACWYARPPSPRRSRKCTPWRRRARPSSRSWRRGARSSSSPTTCSSTPPSSSRATPG